MGSSSRKRHVEKSRICPLSSVAWQAESNLQSKPPSPETGITSLRNRTVSLGKCACWKSISVTYGYVLQLQLRFANLVVADLVPCQTSKCLPQLLSRRRVVLRDIDQERQPRLIGDGPKLPF